MQIDVYTKDGTAKLPTLGKKIGKGGNALVCICNVTTPSGETYKFACKVEQRVSLYIAECNYQQCVMLLQNPLYKKANIFEKVCQLEDNEHFVIIHAYLKGN